MSGQALRKLEEQWGNVVLLIVDEVSFIGRAFLACMQHRWQQGKRGSFAEASLDPDKFSLINFWWSSNIDAQDASKWILINFMHLCKHMLLPLRCYTFVFFCVSYGYVGLCELVPFWCKKTTNCGSPTFGLNSRILSNIGRGQQICVVVYSLSP